MALMGSSSNFLFTFFALFYSPGVGINDASQQTRFVSNLFPSKPANHIWKTVRVVCLVGGLKMRVAAPLNAVFTLKFPFLGTILLFFGKFWGCQKDL